ncbi:hypothetical protein [endosymbiont GvMRE of Glomus versiforme]|uniref:hypothetical protein n=1 Tax=endosymbiont GvMRE of Glomus versiforme TaxID=2039283 RepID=UPI000EDD9DA9|nr:hypothetical protein [endosymbiont GvMRE of Glomus versiforme]RHZ35988.1 hypothetical protein GvMRE_Ic3g53 [endosymbiont GvMRE of Glomus versiforme]
MKFSFGYLYLHCIHETDFTNSIQQDSSFQLAFLQMLNDYSNKSWPEIKKISGHWHLVKENDRRRLGKYMQMSERKINNLVKLYSVYQIAIEEEGTGRVYGVLKEFGNDHLFEFLFLDPNHLFHYNFKKSNYPSGAEAKCFLKTVTCNKVWTVKWKKQNKKLIKK